jgi:trehalose/maltose hydrolase-like predicted phosphorylase
MIDLLGEGKQYVGTLYIGGTHPAGNGGAWISAVFGLCGIHCAQETITIDPHLPAHWTKVSLPLIFRGQRVRITLTHETVQVTPNPLLETPLTISVNGEVAPIHASEGTTLSYTENNR